MNPPAAFRRLAGSAFARSVGVLASGTAAGQLLIILASPALTRLYRPADFGAFAVFGAALFTLLQIASLRYEWAILLPERDDRAADLLALSLGLATAVPAALELAVLLAGERFVRWTNTPELGPWLWLLPVSLWAAGIYQALSQWAIRHREFQPIARSQVSQNLARVVCQVGLGFLPGGGFGAMGLVVGDVVGRWSGAAGLALRIRRGTPPRLGAATAAGMAAEARRYRRFPFLSGGASLLNQAGLQLTPVLLAALWGAQAAGWYALGQRVVALPLVMVGYSIAQVYAGHASDLARSDAPALRRLFLRTAGSLGLIGAVPFGLLAAFGPRLFGLVFGADWAETGRYFQVLAPLCLAQFVVVPLSQTLAILERQSLQLAWDSLCLLLMVGLFAGAARAGLAPLVALGLYSGAMVLAYGALFLLMLSEVGRGEIRLVARAVEGEG
jgi:O-antigen/teichoic acid export membrane protein